MNILKRLFKKKRNYDFARRHTSDELVIRDVLPKLTHKQLLEAEKRSTERNWK